MTLNLNKDITPFTHVFNVFKYFIYSHVYRNLSSFISRFLCGRARIDVLKKYARIIIHKFVKIVCRKRQEKKPTKYTKIKR